MVNWGALIEAPIGVFLLYIAVALLEPIQVPLFGILGNSEAFPQGATTIVIVQLLSLILAVMLIWSAYRSFREPEQPFLVPR